MQALELQADSHVSRLVDLWVRCPKPGCGSKDEAEPVTLWRRLGGLHNSARDLGGCWERRAAEWKDVALSVSGVTDRSTSGRPGGDKGATRGPQRGDKGATRGDKGATTG